MISSAGVWQAQDLLATLQEQTLRGIGLADAELRYVAPELLTGRTADVRSDIFTMGVLLYEMATGALPFDGASMPELLGTMLRGEPIDPGRCSRRCRNRRRPRCCARCGRRRRIGSRPSARSAPPSVPRPDDRIHGHRLAQRLVQQVPVHQPVVRARLEQVEREPGQRLLHVDPQRAGRQLALGRRPRAGERPLVVLFEGALRQLCWPGS